MNNYLEGDRLRTIQISNTLGGHKETLKTCEANHVKMYACGVTVYDYCHIGHAMQAIYFDVIRNYLEFAGYRVTYVRNYTDVDDKIINRARDLGIDPLKLSQDVITATERDMGDLGIRPATYEPKVSDCIPEIVTMIQTLITKGFAYATQGGDVYYRVRSKDDYGKLSNRKPDDMRSGTRDIVQGDKEDELDFALWKTDNTPGASWESPWGKGRPGWHIECSVMAKKYLGDHFDIHGGGRDLVFPHHENEIAQSEAANSCAYASYWMHNGLLTIDKQKMSKSLGNHIMISDFLKRWPAEVLRLAYLQQHYSSNTELNQSVFKQCARRLLYFYESLRAFDEIGGNAPVTAPFMPGHDPQALVEAFHREMSNDFSTVGALRELNVAFRKANELKTAKNSPSRQATAQAWAKVLRELFYVLGLLKQDPLAFIESLKDKILPELNLTRQAIEQRIQDRTEARNQKDFSKADQIRKSLHDDGIEMMDTPQGTTWTIRFNVDEPMKAE